MHMNKLMIQATSATSGKYSILVKYSPIGTNLFTILDSNGDIYAAQMECTVTGPTPKEL